MADINPKVDAYLAIGCGRCPLFNTPKCKVHSWQYEMAELRRILLDTELSEELKWSVPCYTFEGNNVVLLSAFNDYCALSFFKGVLMKDPDNILVAQTENVQSTRQIRFTNGEDVLAIEATVRAYIHEALEVEKSGLKITPKKTEQFDVPDELISMFEDDPTFEAAFEALTQGRQRGYLLHFSGAKQSKTRTSRIEKCMPKIFEGKGWNDR